MNFWTFLTLILCVIFIYAYPKILLWIALASFAGWIIYNLYYSNKKSIHDSVKVEIKYDLNRCPKDFPLAINIHNKGNKVIHEINIGVCAFKPGFSNQINRHYNIDIYRIFNQYDSYGWCYKLPKFTEPFPPEEATYSVQYKHLKLDDGEHIYQPR